MNQHLKVHIEQQSTKPLLHKQHKKKTKKLPTQKYYIGNY